MTAFGADGFSMGTVGGMNFNSQTYVAWAWKANGGSRTTFTESGDNPGGGHQANTTAGFSIIDYVGTGDNAATVAHGLGAVPHWIMIKNRDTAQTWVVYHHRNTDAPETDILQLEATNVTYDSNTYFNDTAPTSTNITLGTSNDLNKDDDNIVAYAWTEVQGFSKFGRYNGNGTADGVFIYTGFKPSLVIIKSNSKASQGWHMLTGTIGTGNANPLVNAVDSNDTAAERGTFTTDFVSNGFKINHSSGGTGSSNETYVYMAFAKSPFVSSEGVPTTAE